MTYKRSKDAQTRKMRTGNRLLRSNVLLTAACFSLAVPSFAQQTITGKDAFAGATDQKPGIRRKITIADLPEPNPAESVDSGNNLIARPEGAWPIAPAGFKVTLYAGGDNGPIQRSDIQKEVGPPTHGTFREPRLIRTAPNGDLFLSDSAAGTVYVLRGAGPDGKAAHIEKFATGLDHPFGIAFFPNGSNPQSVYIGTATTIQRLPYHSGDLHATGPAETVVPDIPGYAQLRGGGHWTRDVVFSQDGTKMLVSVGSGSNVDDPDTHPKEFHRADVLEYTPQGKFLKIYASGIRNCVGEAINPTTGQLWCSVNERDELGNHLVPDYVTSIQEDGFYGWPWFYMGGHQDPRLLGKHPELKAKVITPDVLVQPHMASLEMAFATKLTGKSGSLPTQFDGDAFAAEHGSWNRLPITGYEVVRIPMHAGHADGSYEDFLTGFVTPEGKVWGRPVGVTIAKDGSMFVTDDGSRSVWHITYEGNAGRKTASR